MRIKRLELKAFGPFTDKVLEFPSAGPDLHVIYGPNEAGKSSTLRALTAWLYGFEERTADNFLHANDQLLVAGLLENGHGEALFMARRKKRKSDLLDAAGNPIDAGLLAALLPGVDQATFKKLFGLDHDTLVQGGIDILQEKGSAGTALFAAGTGIASIHQVLADLREESEKIFKGRAAKPLLNAALRAYSELKREIARKSLSSREWKEHDKALRQARKELVREQESRRDLDRERRRLERIGHALTPLGVRRELREKLAGLGEVRALPDDFSRRRLASQNQLRGARQTLTAAALRLKEFHDKAEGIQVDTELLDQAATIRDLHQRLGAYRKGMADLPILEGKRVQEKTAAGNILRRIRPDLSLESVETLRPLLRRRRSIQELGAKLPLLEEKAASARREVRKLDEAKQKAETARQNLPGARDLRPLATAISQALRLGEVDAELETRARELARSQDHFACELKQSGLWCGSPAELLAVAFPMAETIHRFSENLRGLAEESRVVRQRHEEAEQRRKQLLRDIGAIEKAGEVPTEKELAQLRAQRDRGWSLLRRQWLEGVDIEPEAHAYHPQLPLPEAYEELVAQADGTADRLRREAGRVHKYAHLIAEREGAEQEITELSARQAALDEQIRREEARWAKTWQPCGVSPLPPGEMARWAARIENLRLQARQIVGEEEKIGLLRRQRRGGGEELRQALQPLQASAPAGEELAPLLRVAEEFHRQAAETEQKRSALQQQLAELEEEIAVVRFEASQAQEALAAWQTGWGEILRELGLSAQETPGGADDFFAGLEACLDHLEKAEEFRKRRLGIERDAEELKARVAGLLTRVAPELVLLEVDQAIERLSGLLSRASENAATLKTYGEGIARAEDEIREATAEIETAEAELAELCRLAGCGRQEELEAAERQWQEQLRLNERIAEEEARLLQLADGQPLEELERQALLVDPDALPGQLEEIAEQLDLVQGHLDGISQLIGKEETELARMDGGAEAAQLAEQAEEKLSEVRRLARQYACLRIAAKVLEEEIERYRAENQDPVLKLASGYFSELTLGSFDGLRTDVDDKGEQVIVGLRNGGERVVVDAMSSGTRDQLFLALRLGSLEHRLEKEAPMPFIVDDILINFDEERSAATLKALGRLARKNQVVLFTHHQRVAEAAAAFNGGFISLK